MTDITTIPVDTNSLMCTFHIINCCIKCKWDAVGYKQKNRFSLRSVIVLHDIIEGLLCIDPLCFVASPQSSASRSSESGPEPETLHRLHGVIPKQPGLTWHQLTAVQRQTRSVSLYASWFISIWTILQICALLVFVLVFLFLCCFLKVLQITCNIALKG